MAEVASSGLGPGFEINFQLPTIVESVAALSSLSAFIYNIVVFRNLPPVNQLDAFSVFYDPTDGLYRAFAIGTIIGYISPMYVLPLENKS